MFSVSKLEAVPLPSKGECNAYEAGSSWAHVVPDGKEDARKFPCELRQGVIEDHHLVTHIACDDECFFLVVMIRQRVNPSPALWLSFRDCRVSGRGAYDIRMPVRTSSRGSRCASHSQRERLVRVHALECLSTQPRGSVRGGP